MSGIWLFTSGQKIRSTLYNRLSFIERKPSGSPKICLKWSENEILQGWQYLLARYKQSNSWHCVRPSKNIFGVKYSYDSSLLWNIRIFQQNLPHSIAYMKISLKMNIIWHAPSLFSIFDSKSWYKMEIFEIFTSCVLNQTMRKKICWIAISL